MTADKNKGITDISYNYLNLPSKVTKDANNYIIYTYDAAGIKLRQQVTTAGSIKTTDYAGEFIYEDNALKFVQHEEGRILPPSESGTGTWEYQYHLKDHLGNTRVSFTTKPSTTTSSATMEMSASSTESQLFMNYDEVKTVDSELFDHTNKGKGKSGHAVRLRGVEGERTGLAQSLKVSKGDTIKAAVFVKYLDNEKANWTAALQGLMTAIAHGGNAGGNGNGVDANPGGGAANTFDPSGGFADLGAGEKGHGIYLNAIFFDKDMNYKKAVYKKMSDTPKENGENVEHEKLDIAVPVEEEGYMYVYYSNESATMTEAYYDDFSVTLVQAEIIQADDYYPFGGQFHSYQRAGTKENKYLYNGKEIIEDLDLGWYSYGARNYDASIGRFFNVDPKADLLPSWSPYNYALGNPILFLDPDGQYPWPFHIRSFISTPTTGGGLFRGDGRGPSTASAPNATSRVRSTFTVDPAKGSISGLSYRSDPTVFYGGYVPPVGYIPPSVKEGNPTASITNESFSEGSASFNFSHSGKDPITPQWATPALDVHSALTVSEDLENGVLSITGSFTGDKFPSTEAFVVDQPGEVKVFLGAQKEDGGLGDLYGDNKKSLFNVNMQIQFDGDGNFTGVRQGDQTYSVEDWNKRVQDGF